MELLLHIGTEKTGSTSFQSYMYNARERLKSEGVWYCESLCSVQFKPNHRKLSVFARKFGEQDDGFAIHGIFSEDDHIKFQENLRAKFYQEVQAANASGARSFVISSEHLHSRIQNVTAAEKIKAFFGGCFSKITILAHLRPQADLALSFSSTAARFGVPIDRGFFEAVNPRNHYYDYLGMLNIWRSVFPGADLVVKSYRQFPSTLKIVSEILGFEVDKRDSELRLNSSLSTEAIALLNAVKGKFDAAVLNLDNFPGEKFLLSKLEVGEIQSKFENDNRDIASIFGLQRDYLEPDMSKYPENSSLDKLISLKSSSGVLLHALNSLAYKVELEKAFRSLAEAERATLKSNFETAREKLKAYEAHARKIEVEAPHLVEKMPNLERVKKVKFDLQ